MKCLRYIVLISIFLASHSISYSQPNLEQKICGVTIDDITNLNQIVVSLGKLSIKPTTRIVFDESAPASQYVKPLKRIHKVSNILGELLDSYDMKDYSVSQYEDRVKDYIDKLSDNVDIWEIGNEVNGEWLGNTDSVVLKINFAYNYAKSMDKKTALTLYYNSHCFEHDDNEMFNWVINKLTLDIGNGIDYLLISYYEDDCNEFQPNWQQVFDSLHVLFPNSLLGIGECGTENPEKREEYMNRYYSMSISTMGFIGGCFWWYFTRDCVPYTKPLWKVLNNAIQLSNIK
jgi:hypothetical protein